MRRPYNFQCSDENHPIFSVGFSFAEYDELANGKIEIRCPVCNAKAAKTMKGCTITSYIRGQGIVLDKEGAKREANIWQLENDDPYKKLRRQSKESKSDAIDKIRSGEKYAKQRQPNTTLKYDENAEIADEEYQYCPACTRTLPESSFENGEDYRCEECTTNDVKPTYTLKYDTNQKKYILKWAK